MHTSPPDATHWSVRTTAKVEALRPTMTHRIWQAHELQPHQVETFKLSADADLNDAARLSTDPTFRLIGSPTRWDVGTGARR